MQYAIGFSGKKIEEMVLAKASALCASPVADLRLAWSVGDGANGTSVHATVMHKDRRKNFRLPQPN